MRYFASLLGGSTLFYYFCRRICDDIASFLPVYLDKKILKVDPFRVPIARLAAAQAAVEE